MKTKKKKIQKKNDFITSKNRTNTKTKYEKGDFE